MSSGLPQAERDGLIITQVCAADESRTKCESLALRQKRSAVPKVLCFFELLDKFEFVGVIDFGILRRISTAPSPRELPNASEAEGVFC